MHARHQRLILEVGYEALYNMGASLSCAVHLWKSVFLLFSRVPVSGLCKGKLEGRPWGTSLIENKSGFLKVNYLFQVDLSRAP